METGALILVVGMIVFMAIGAPIYLSILLSSLATLLMTGMRAQAIIQRLYAANDSFPLLAIPFFFLAGELMLQGGIAKRIVDFCKMLLGGLKGSLAVISFVACAFFGAISGSSYATTASIGKLMYPEMCKDGYRPAFAAIVQAVGGTLGVLIPPSILCVLYGVATGESVGDMLLYIVPVGILTTLCYIITALIVIGKKHNPAYVPVQTEVRAEKLSAKKFISTTLDAFWALLTPVIILGGIYSGVFTPTECAVVATVYAWLVGTLIYRELPMKTALKAICDAIIGSACIIMIVDAANVFSWLLTVNRVATAVATAVQSTISNPYTFLLLVNVVYLVAGMFLEGSVTITIIVPLLYPIAVMYGVNGIHFGLITILNCILGTLTPPFGGALFVTNTVTRVPVASILKEVIPFLIGGFTLCLLVTYVPLIWLM